MKKQILIFGSSLFFLFSCSSSKTTTETADNGAVKGSSSNSELTAVLWQQNAAEYDALCYQAYNSAMDQLNRNIEGGDVYDGHPSAIIMDLDETVLDNSPYNAKLILENETYNSDSWSEWVNLVEADLVPGAKTFIEMAKSKGIEIIYISNRSVDLLEPTIANLTKEGIEVNPENVFLKADEDNKIRRRRMISERYQIVMLIGDNLADFTDEFDMSETNPQRKEMVEGYKSEFGRKLIVLPNPMYGEWLNAIESPSSDGSNPKKFLKAY